MQLTTDPTHFRPRRWGRCGLLVVAATTLLLLACDPVPPADGRDLSIQAINPPTHLAPGEHVNLTATVTNHGNATASGARVGYLVPSQFTVDSITGPQVTACTQQVGIGSCGIGDLSPGATRTVTLTVTGITAAPAEDLMLLVNSSAAEPDPDPHPNQALVPLTVGLGRGIYFTPVPRVAVGEVFDVTGVAVSEVAIPGYFISIALPPNIEAVSVSSGSVTTPCQPRGACEGIPYAGVANGSIVTMRLRAVSPGPPAGVRLSISTIGITIVGNTTVQVIDPAIISEVHPELDPVTDGVVGTPQTIRGVVRNTGSTDHTAVTATMALSPGLRVDDARHGSAGLPCAVNSSIVTCTLGGIPAYGAADVTVQVTPMTAGPASTTLSTVTSVAQDDPDPVPDTDTATFQISGDYVDLGLTPYSSPNTPVGGVDWYLQPTIKNHGTTAATGTRLVMTLPAGVTIGDSWIAPPAPADSAGCTVAGQVVTCEVGTLAPGHVAEIRVQSTVTAGTTGTVVTTVSSDRAEPNPDLNPNLLTQAFTVLAPRADLFPQFLQPPSTVGAGQPVTFQYEVNSFGPSETNDAVGTFEVPADWTITSSVFDLNGVNVACEVTGSTSRCPVGLAAVGASRTMSLTAVPNQVATGQVVTAGASSSLPDDNPSNNQLSQTIDVIATRVDLGVTADYTSTAYIGATSNVDLLVDNSGTTGAADTTLTATLPASVQLVNIYTFSSGFTCQVAGQAITCTHPLLPTGRRAVRLAVRHNALGVVSFTAAVTTSTPQVPDNLANSVEITRTVEPQAATLTGTVVDANAAPVSQVAVWVYRVGESSFSFSATTDGTGKYAFYSLPPGQYQVRFLPPSPPLLLSEWFDDQPLRADAAVFTTANLGETLVANAELAPKALTVIRGTVSDQMGQPVAGVVVGAYHPYDGYIPSHQTTTAADGSYSFTVQDGEYKVRFGPPANSGLRAEWFDDKALRAAATSVQATAGGQVVVADSVLSPLP